MCFSCLYLQKNKSISNQQQALAAFYQKKITLHTPILVRYLLSSFQILNENGKLKFIDTVTNLSTNEKEIIIKEIFPVSDSRSKYYLITNIGILIARLLNDNQYEITDLFLETTPGRLIFNINFKTAIQK